MRITSYNILDGGEGRADPLAEVIEAQHPDVVCLVEAENRDVVERIANRLKMDFIYAPGNTKASALLCRFPILQTINHGPLHKAITKSFLEATVVDPAGSEWVFGVAHLHAHAGEEDEKIRQGEIEQILEIFRPHRESNRPHVLAGDFNANAPSQQIDPAKVKPSTREEFHKNGGHIPRRVIQQVLEAGYMDSLHVVHPREAETSGTFSTQFPGQRVDFIFTFAVDPPRCRQAWIEYDRLAKYASDHFPIGLEIT